MILDFKVSERPTHGIIFREALACLAWGAFYPLGIRKSERKTKRKAEQRTVVFIHGYLANPASFYPLSVYLRSCGHPQPLHFHYQAKDGIEQAARELREFLRRRVRGGRIDLVCHSLGGVIGRVYLQELGGSRRVDRCITLGTPHAVTYNSYWVNTRVGRELRPDSELMRRLNAGRAARVRFTDIVGGADNIVIPRVFASHAPDTVHIPDVGHVGLLFSPKVFFEVARRLGPDQAER